VENQLYIALITICLLSLIKAANDYKGSLLELTRLLITCQNLSKSFWKGSDKNLLEPLGGRVRLRHELIFEQMHHQVMEEMLILIW